MSIDVMKQALEAAYLAGFMASSQGHNAEYPFQQYDMKPEDDWDWCERRDTALRLAIEQAEKQEPVAQMLYRYGDEWRLNEPNWDGWDFDECMPFYTAPPQRQPLTDSVREMRDVQGRDGTWNYDPYMHGLYNGLEFAVSLLEQREPQFKDAPEKWLCDLPKPRIFSDAHGIGGEA